MSLESPPESAGRTLAEMAEPSQPSLPMTPSSGPHRPQDPARPHHPAHPHGVSLGAFLAVLLGLGVIVLGTGLVIMTVLFMRERRKGEERDAELAAAHDALNKASNRETSTRSPHPELPTVERHVPTHSLRVLEGCSPTNLDTITDLLGDAIEQGAPLYNQGDFGGCYRTYVAAALEIEHRMPKTCPGPAEALVDGRTNAKARNHMSEKAWAMRDAFDGLLEVVARSKESGGGANL